MTETDLIATSRRENPNFYEGWDDAMEKVNTLPDEYSEQHEYWRGYALRLMDALDPTQLRPKWTEPIRAIRFWLANR